MSYTRGLGQYASPIAEICATNHCDYYRWGAPTCIAAWDQVNASGGPGVACGAPALLVPAPSVNVPPVEVAPPVTIQPVGPPVPPPTPGPMPAPAAPQASSAGCPVEYPRGHWDASGQLICERPIGLEPIPVPVAYGAQRVPVPKPPGQAGYAPTAAPLAAIPVPAPVDEAAYTAQTTPPRTTEPWLAWLPNWAVIGSMAVVGLLAVRGATR